MKRKIRYGMIGGGIGGFIGRIHRMAGRNGPADRTRQRRFSSDPERTHETGVNSSSPIAMLSYLRRDDSPRSRMPADQRPDFIAIVTPNHLHLPAAELALQHGFHVLSDKPATLNLKEAKLCKT